METLIVNKRIGEDLIIHTLFSHNASFIGKVSFND